MIRSASAIDSHANGDLMSRLLMTGRSDPIGSAIANRLKNHYDELINIEHQRITDDDIVVDFTDDVALAEAVRRVPGRIDTVVVAHRIGEPGTTESIRPQGWRRTLDVNLTSVYVLIQNVVDKLSDSASIVIVGSTAGFDHSAYAGVDYTVSRWGTNGMVRHLAQELGPRGIRINAVCPGWVDLRPDDNAPDPTDYAAIPLRRPARTREISDLVAFLSSERASYITGALVPISGGWQ